ncbi:hypothetical protein NDU88_008576 [Pleurodeles waltl]|uniref:Reverse transcriptase domain-containing protein n=1 Tax=Pleurodeles waltl TaxID=8319 RepID=A0AAV7RTM4_PLEWA|nr:hypothetical protein NDU88_008576 [Pleurodeles waltl]
MDNGETVALNLLDLSAAFDTVCHRTLITRLRSTGIQGQALDWIASFLSNRSQRVYLPPFRSEPTEIICGVPQGSSLSPTLFNVYMSPLANIVRKHDIIITSYADDTQLILSLTKDPASAKTNLQEGMKDVADWKRLSRRDHSKTPKSPATHSKRLGPPHPRHTPQQPHLRTPETPALAPSQQKDHLPTSHPRTQSPPRQGTGIPQQTPQLLRPHPPPPLLWPRTRCCPSHPPLHSGWEIFLLPGGQDLELPPHQPQDHPGPLRFPETPKDLAVRAAITPLFPLAP